MVELSIIILNYNTCSLLDGCLQSIVNNLKGVSYEIIVIDNNSSDDSRTMVKKKYPEAILKESKENLGYGKGNNIGIKISSGKYILILNSDTLLIKDGIQMLLEYVKTNSKVGIAGPGLLNKDGSKQKSVGVFYTPLNAILMLFGAERLGFLRYAPDNPSMVDWVSGACLMIKKEIFDRIGSFDEKLFMYMEDVEFCYRAKQYGILTACFPQAKIFHLVRGSSIDGKKDAILNIYRGIIYFYQKYIPEKLLLIKTALKIKALMTLVIGGLTLNRNLIRTYGQAYKLAE